MFTDDIAFQITKDTLCSRTKVTDQTRLISQDNPIINRINNAVRTQKKFMAFYLCTHASIGQISYH